MEKKIIIPLVAIALLGIFFLGKGITGYIISQSCCFPPDCKLEDMCESAKPFIEHPEKINHMTSIYLGFILILFSVISYIILHKK